MNTPPPAAPSAAAPSSRARFALRWPVWVGSLVGIVLVYFLFQINEGVRLLLGISIAGILFALTMRAPATGFAAALCYLAVMGEVRRILIPAYGWSGTDPLLLVSGMTVLLALGATRRNATRSTLARRILLLTTIMGLEVVNPSQGGLVIGFSGLLFYLVPMLWFQAAGRMATLALAQTLGRTVIGIAVVASLYGLWQTAFGFTDFERQWMHAVAGSYDALAVTETQIRAFSFFTSASEYAQFLALGLVMTWVFFLRGVKSALLLSPLLAVALFLETSRGPIVIVTVVSTILWAVQGRTRATWLPRIALALVLAVVGGIWSLKQLQSTQFGDTAQSLVKHQTEGLLNPTDEKKSSAPGHVSRLLYGIGDGFRRPLGLGLGATTIAGQKFGSGSAGTEVDVSDMFVGLGCVGGILYVVIVVTTLRRALDFWQATRSTAALVILGLLLSSLGGWLTGGNYAGAMLAWSCVGALDRLWQPASSASAARTALPPPVPAMRGASS